MANLSAGEGMMFVGGIVDGPIICEDDNQGVVVKCGSNYKDAQTHVIHTGKYGRIYNDVFPLGEENCAYPNQEYMSLPCARLITTNHKAELFDNGQQTVITALGTNSQINYGYWTAELHGRPINDVSKVMSGNAAFLAGDSSTVTIGEYDFVDSIVMSVGASSLINLAGHSYPNHNYRNNKVVAAGAGSFIETSDDCVVVTVGADSNVTVGGNSVILSSETSVTFSVGLGSCAAVVWHDGTRKRIKVVYEGENGILADTQYTIDQSGNVVAV